ncbi:MAG TPA: universal stress protein [Chloroflexota bacterium]|nr:universal stress protein [Chloroflexota bacterium]
MIKRLLVGLDGSHFAEGALPYAEALARASDALVTLVRVVPNLSEAPQPPPDDGEPQEREASPRVFAALLESPREDRNRRHEAEHYLDEIAAHLMGNKVRSETALGFGDPAQFIIDEALARAANLIILGTHGRSGLGRWIYGSVADQVMRHAPVPVLLVPNNSRAWPRTRPPRILVPLDGSPVANEAIGSAKELAELLGAEMTLVGAVPPPIYAYTYADMPQEIPEQLDDEQVDLHRYLEEVANDLRTTGRIVRTEVAFDSPVSAISDIARQKEIDLIVMSTHGSGGVTRLVIGSVANGVIRRVNVPVLVVRPAVNRANEAPPVANQQGHDLPMG